jgi:hypothetical protein
MIPFKTDDGGEVTLPEEKIREAMERRVALAEGMCRVFLDKYGLGPNQIELVEIHDRDPVSDAYRIRFSFKVKDSVKEEQNGLAHP